MQKYPRGRHFARTFCLLAGLLSRCFSSVLFHVLDEIRLHQQVGSGKHLKSAPELKMWRNRQKLYDALLDLQRDYPLGQLGAFFSNTRNTGIV